MHAWTIVVRFLFQNLGGYSKVILILEYLLVKIHLLREADGKICHALFWIDSRRWLYKLAFKVMSFEIGYRGNMNLWWQVYVDTLSEEDFLYISNALFPRVPKALLEKLIKFNSRIFQDTMISRSYGHVGAPWEFNLRDVLRSCTLIGGDNNGYIYF